MKKKKRVLKTACETGRSVDFESQDGTIFNSGVKSNGRDEIIFNEMGSSASLEGKTSDENEVVDANHYKSIKLV